MHAKAGLSLCCCVLYFIQAGVTRSPIKSRRKTTTSSVNGTPWYICIYVLSHPSLPLQPLENQSALTTNSQSVQNGQYCWGKKEFVQKNLFQIIKYITAQWEVYIFSVFVACSLLLKLVVIVMSLLPLSLFNPEELYNDLNYYHRHILITEELWYIVQCAPPWEPISPAALICLIILKLQ